MGRMAEVARVRKTIPLPPYAAPMTPPPGRRERKKQETRSTIVGAALGLFAQYGFDAVTVNEIAEAADVDPSTFFRHFAAKEAVLFADLDALHDDLKAAVLVRPPEEDVITASTRALQATLSQLQRSPDQERVRQLLIETTPSVRGWMSSVLTKTAEAMAEALAERMDADPVEDPRPYLVAVLVVEAGHWMRTNRLAHGSALNDQALAADLPELLTQLVP